MGGGKGVKMNKWGGRGCQRSLVNLINREVTINGRGVEISNYPLILVMNEKRDIND